MVLAAFLFMKRTGEVTNVQFITRDMVDEDDVVDPQSIPLRDVPRGIEVFEIDGPFFFGAAERFEEALGRSS